MTRNPLKRRSSVRGYTLMELIIALGIGVGILLALMLMFSSNSGNQQEVERTLRRTENARFAVDTLTEDVMHAGFFSDFNPNRVAAPGVAYTTPSPCANSVADLGWNAAASPIQIPLPVEGIQAGTGDFGCLEGRVATTEALVIRRAETGPTVQLVNVFPVVARRNNLYIQATRCDKDTDLIRVASIPSDKPEETFSLLRPDCTTRNEELRRLVQRTYFVSSCNECNPSDGMPTLKRVEFIDGSLRTTSIAEGIENVRFEFGVDSTGDGVPDATVPASGVVAAGGWQNVVSVRVHVLTRSTQPSPGFIDGRTYQLAGVSVAPNDGFKRTLMSTTARLNNVGGRRE